MFIRVTLTLFCFLYLANVNAQVDFNNYKPIRCVGEIPEDLTADAKLLYELKALKIEDSDKGKRRQADEKEFFLQNNFSIQDFLLSGQILYNDTFTRYIEKIADTLLKNNPQLRKKLRFYTVKSPEVNAFATQEGIVFVNMGLISSVKNEAQIAYVLAHEISHYTEGHVLQGFLETRRIVRGEGSYRFKDYYTRLRSFFRYSRDSEFEADEKGWEIFKNSPYSKEVVSGVFDMLLYAHIHYDSILFNPSIFEEKDYRFPSSYQKDTVSHLHVDENWEDNFSTHPNVRDRKKRTNELIDDDTIGGSYYVVSKSDFENLQKIARYEMLRYYIGNTNFADAYYHALLLENTYETGDYIDKHKIMALYGLAKHFNNKGKRRSIILPYEDVQSTPQQFYYFLHQLDNSEITVLALREAMKIGERSVESTFYNQVKEDLIMQLIVNNKVRPEDFYQSYHDNNLSQKPKEKNYWKYAFVDELKDPFFLQKLREYETYQSQGNNFKKLDKFGRNTLLEKGKLKDLSIDEIVIFQPSFQVVKEGVVQMPKVDYLESLEEQNLLREQINEAAQDQDISLSYIEQIPQNYTTEKYNAYSNYINWLTERANNNMEMAYLNNLNLLDTSKSQYVGFVEVQSVTESYLIKKFHKWEYNFLVYDKNTGKLIFYETWASIKKYKRKKLYKILNASFKTLKEKYPSEE